MSEEIEFTPATTHFLANDVCHLIGGQLIHGQAAVNLTLRDARVVRAE